MTGHIQDQISAFIDDELSAEECAFFVRRLERDPEVRNQMIRYVTAGAAIRGELLRPEPDVLRRRLQAALDGATNLPVPVKLRARDRAGAARYARPMLGTGIAAGVAIVALFALKAANQTAVGPAVPAPVETLQAAQTSEPASYVVPQEAAAIRLAPPIRLTNYLMHHGEYASRLSRTSVRSNVVSTREAGIAVEGEEALQR
jgi:negative regulator of sigma E activity